MPAQPRSRGGTGSAPRRMGPDVRVPTVRDVAADAGVSLGTVSLALNAPFRLRPATLARVEASIARLGFIRNEGARSLRGAAEGIGMVIPDLFDADAIEMARGASEAVRESGRSLLLATAAAEGPGSAAAADDQGEQGRLLERFAQWRLQGIVIVTRTDPTPAIRRIRHHVPAAVVVGFDASHADWCSVDAAAPGGSAHELGRAAIRLLEAETAPGHRHQRLVVGGPLPDESLAACG